MADDSWFAKRGFKGYAAQVQEITKSAQAAGQQALMEAVPGDEASSFAGKQQGFLIQGKQEHVQRQTGAEGDITSSLQRAAAKQRLEQQGKYSPAEIEEMLSSY